MILIIKGDNDKLKRLAKELKTFVKRKSLTLSLGDEPVNEETNEMEAKLNDEVKILTAKVELSDTEFDTLKSIHEQSIIDYDAKIKSLESDLKNAKKSK